MLELLERQQGCGEVYAMRPNLEGSRPRVHYRWHSPPRSQRRKNRAVCLANSGTRLGPLEVEFPGRHCKRRQCYVNKSQISAFYH